MKMKMDNKDDEKYTAFKTLEKIRLGKGSKLLNGNYYGR